MCCGGGRPHERLLCVKPFEHCSDGRRITNEKRAHRMIECRTKQVLHKVVHVLPRFTSYSIPFRRASNAFVQSIIKRYAPYGCRYRFRDVIVCRCAYSDRAE